MTYLADYCLRFLFSLDFLFIFIFFGFSCGLSWDQFYWFYFIYFLLCKYTSTMPMRKNTSYKRKGRSSTSKKSNYSSYIPKSSAAMINRVPKYKTRQMDVTYMKGKDWITNKLVNRMEYMTPIYYSSVSGPTTYVFRGNSIYDPDQTGTGSQPLGFSTLTTIYSVYECPRSSIKAEFINNTAVPVWLTICPVVTAGDGVTYFNSSGRPGAKSVYCTSNNSTQHGVLYNIAKTFDILGLPDGDSNCRGNATSNPASQWYWQVIMTPCDGASSVSGVLNIKLIYYTLWEQRKII